MKKQMFIYGLLLSAVMANSAMAEIAIIASPGFDKKLSESEVKNIFLGKGANDITPVEVSEGSAISDEFASKVLNKKPAQLKSYWSRLIFTGKGRPPKRLGGEDAVISYVKSNPNSISYVSGAKAGGANVILRIP